jgi:hypothetical protein
MMLKKKKYELLFCWGHLVSNKHWFATRPPPPPPPLNLGKQHIFRFLQISNGFPHSLPYLDKKEPHGFTVLNTTIGANGGESLWRRKI